LIEILIFPRSSEITPQINTGQEKNSSKIYLFGC
jgi:hypothetical protein